MDFVNIFACSHPSQLHVFVRFEKFSLPRISKVSNLVFIFNILFSITLKGELQRENKLISYEGVFKMLENDMYIAGIGQAVLQLLSFKVGSGNHQRGILSSFTLKGELQRENKLISYERVLKMLENDIYIAGIGLIKPGLHIVVRVAEHACDDASKRILKRSAHRLKIFLVKYQNLIVTITTI